MYKGSDEPEDSLGGEGLAGCAEISADLSLDKVEFVGLLAADFFDFAGFGVGFRIDI